MEEEEEQSVDEMLKAVQTYIKHENTKMMTSSDEPTKLEIRKSNEYVFSLIQNIRHKIQREQEKSYPFEQGGVQESFDISTSKPTIPKLSFIGKGLDCLNSNSAGNSNLISANINNTSIPTSTSPNKSAYGSTQSRPSEPVRNSLRPSGASSKFSSDQTKIFSTHQSNTGSTTTITTGNVQSSTINIPTSTCSGGGFGDVKTNVTKKQQPELVGSFSNSSSSITNTTTQNILALDEYNVFEEENVNTISYRASLSSCGCPSNVMYESLKPFYYDNATQNPLSINNNNKNIITEEADDEMDVEDEVDDHDESDNDNNKEGSNSESVNKDLSIENLNTSSNKSNKSKNNTITITIGDQGVISEKTGETKLNKKKPNVADDDDGGGNEDDTRRTKRKRKPTRPFMPDLIVPRIKIRRKKGEEQLEQVEGTLNSNKNNSNIGFSFENIDDNNLVKNIENSTPSTTPSSISTLTSTTMNKDLSSTDTPQEKIPRRRGRPKGSVNRVKKEIIKDTVDIIFTDDDNNKYSQPGDLESSLNFNDLANFNDSQPDTAEFLPLSQIIDDTDKTPLVNNSDPYFGLYISADKKNVIIDRNPNMMGNNIQVTEISPQPSSSSATSTTTTTTTTTSTEEEVPEFKFDIEFCRKLREEAKANNNNSNNNKKKELLFFDWKLPEKGLTKKAKNHVTKTEMFQAVPIVSTIGEDDFHKYRENQRLSFSLGSAEGQPMVTVHEHAPAPTPVANAKNARRRCRNKITQAQLSSNKATDFCWTAWDFAILGDSLSKRGDWAKLKSRQGINNRNPNLLSGIRYSEMELPGWYEEYDNAVWESMLSWLTEVCADDRTWNELNRQNNKFLRQQAGYRRKGSKVDRARIGKLGCVRSKCDFCETWWQSTSELEKHESIHLAPEDRPYKCSTCGLAFTQSCHLKEHENTHLDKKDLPFSCSQCEFRCASSSKLRYHENTHLDKKDQPFSCSKCEFYCADPSTLRSHENTHVDRANRELKCKFCSATYLDKRALKLHENTHLSSTLAIFPFSCSICDVRFRSEDMYQNHMMVLHQINNNNN